jgi:hypothetical protein
MKKLLILIIGFYKLSDCYASESDNAIDFKLSYSFFRTSSFHSNDLNLRAGINDEYYWLAGYQESPSNFNQLRAGYERTDHFENMKVISSIQLASHGFFGGCSKRRNWVPFLYNARLR